MDSLTKVGMSTRCRGPLSFEDGQPEGGQYVNSLLQTVDIRRRTALQRSVQLKKDPVNIHDLNTIGFTQQIWYCFYLPDNRHCWPATNGLV